MRTTEIAPMCFRINRMYMWERRWAMTGSMCGLKTLFHIIYTHPLLHYTSNGSAPDGAFMGQHRLSRFFAQGFGTCEDAFDELPRGVVCRGVCSRVVWIWSHYSSANGFANFWGIHVAKLCAQIFLLLMDKSYRTENAHSLQRL